MSEPLRAEYPSLAAYLRRRLNEDQRGNVLFCSFTQWGFALAALADTALTLRDMGSEVTCAFWSGQTPLRDTGWTTSHRMAHIVGSATQDDRVRAGLLEAGVAASSMAQPPIAQWQPVETITVDERMNRSAIRAMTYRGSPMGRAILQVHPDVNTPITDDHLWPSRWVSAAARSYAFVYDQTAALIALREVTALAVYNGRFLHDRAAVAAAEDAGLPVLSYDSGGKETDFDLTADATHDWAALQHRMLRLYDEWDRRERDALGSRWFQGRISHADPQNALFVESQVPGTRLDRTDTDCMVVFFSSSGDEIAELELDWTCFFGGQGNALRLLAEQCRQLPGYSLVVRTHPHNRFKPAHDVDQWTADVVAAAPDVHLDQHSPVDSYELMRQADIVVTYGSTTGVEAAFAGKPVIVMGPSAYDLLGCATPVSDAASLRAALAVREPGRWSGAVAYGLMMMRRGFVFAHVERDERHGYRLGSQRFREAAPVVQHASHLIHRIRRWYLTRH